MLKEKTVFCSKPIASATASGELLRNKSEALVNSGRIVEVRDQYIRQHAHAKNGDASELWSRGRGTAEYGGNCAAAIE